MFLAQDEAARPQQQFWKDAWEDFDDTAPGPPCEWDGGDDEWGGAEGAEVAEADAEGADGADGAEVAEDGAEDGAEGAAGVEGADVAEDAL